MNQKLNASEINLVVMGGASGKVVSTICITQEMGELSLMDIMLHNNIPIASSCDGEGVCGKCVINDSILSCQMTFNLYVRKQLNDQNQVVVTVAYL